MAASCRHDHAASQLLHHLYAGHATQALDLFLSLPPASRKTLASSKVFFRRTYLSLLSHVCAYDPPLALVDALLATGVSVNHADVDWSPLLVACTYCASLSVIEALLAAGALLRTRTPWSALYAAVSSRCARTWRCRSRVVMLLLERMEGPTPGEVLLGYCEHAERLDVQVVRRMVELGRDGLVHSVDGKSRGALHLVCARRKVQRDVVEFLLQAGVHVDQADYLGFTPLMLACQRHAPPRVLQVLLDAGADVHASDGELPVALLMRRKTKTNRVEVLLAAGADPAAGLLAACRKRCSEQVVELLLAAFPTRAPSSLLTEALVLACKAKSAVPVLTLLLDAGADCTPALHVARYPRAAEKLARYTDQRRLHLLAVGLLAPPKSHHSPTALTRTSTHSLFDMHIIGIIASFLTGAAYGE